MTTTLLLSLLFTWSNLQEEEKITINVTNIKTNTGFIMIAIYDDEENFLTRRVVTSGKFKVSAKGNLKCDLAIPFGDYAISIFHDKDSDGRLGSNLFKIPNEPIGFSNNASAFFGPPDFEKAVFSFRTPAQEHTIKLK
ncbi:MAG: DUF2141 domain-containing protein [Bacteroidota bacterium]